MTDNNREGLPWMPTVDLSPDHLFQVEGGEVITWAELQRRIVTAADDRGDGNEGRQPVVTPKPDELAMAVEWVTWLLEMGQISCAPELRLILSRLASQEETTRADGEVMKPFAEAADSLDDDHKDGSSIWESAAAMGIDAGDLRKARARLAARQEGGEG